MKHRISVRDCARLLGVSRQTAELYMLRPSRRIAQLRSELIGGRRYTRQPWINEWIRETSAAAQKK